MAGARKTAEGKQTQLPWSSFPSSFFWQKTDVQLPKAEVHCGNLARVQDLKHHSLFPLMQALGDFKVRLKPTLDTVDVNSALVK